jgi:hypothetical protein
VTAARTPFLSSGAGRQAPYARMWPVVIGCLAVSALTLLFPSTPTYDPWAWLLWGREIAHLDLVTDGGPSWKPLPILFTVPFSIFGDDAAPYLWVWIARAGGLLACVMSYRLTRRLVGGTAGIAGGIVAALLLLSSFKYIRDAALGNSEALLAGLFLWAFERHLDGRRDHALYLGFAAALLRPEVWPFLGLYGLWLWFRDPELRVRLALLGGLIPLLWFGPEIWGSGEPFRASTRANNPNPGSAAFADHPGLEVARRFGKVTVAPIVSAVVGLAYAANAYVRRREDQAVLALLGLGLSWLLLVAGMTEAGYAGNQRYLIITTISVCVLAGVGVGRVLRSVGTLAEGFGGGGRRATALVTAACLVAALPLTPLVLDKLDNTNETLDDLRYEASLWSELKTLIDRAGGAERLRACDAWFSGPFQTQLVAYELHLHGVQVGWQWTPPPGAAFRTRTVAEGPLVVDITDDRFRQVAYTRHWRLLTVPPTSQSRSSCPASSPLAPRVPLRPETG